MSTHELDTRVLRSKEGYAEVQKRTFTKWVNANLAKKGLKVDDLFMDLRDGTRMIALLEVISGDHLPRPDKGKGRFVMAGNVDKALKYIRSVVALPTARPLWRRALIVALNCPWGAGRKWCCKTLGPRTLWTATPC
jgi:hypothetical protein